MKKSFIVGLFSSILFHSLAAQTHDYIPVNQAKPETAEYIRVSHSSDLRMLRKLLRRDALPTAVQFSNTANPLQFITVLQASKPALHFVNTPLPDDSSLAPILKSAKLVFENYSQMPFFKSPLFKQFKGELVFLNCKIEDENFLSQISDSLSLCFYNCNNSFAALQNLAAKGFNKTSIEIYSDSVFLYQNYISLPFKNIAVGLSNQYNPAYEPENMQLFYNPIAGTNLFLKYGDENFTKSQNQWIDSVFKKLGFAQRVQTKTALNSNISKVLGAETKIQPNSITSNLQELNSEKTESLDIPANENTTMVLQNGSVLRFPKNAFTDSTGRLADGDINITVVSYDDAADMIVNKIPMTTMVGNKTEILVSNTMLNIQASSKGIPLKLAPGKSIDWVARKAPTPVDSFYALANNADYWINYGLAQKSAAPTPMVNPFDTSKVLKNLDNTSLDDRYEDPEYWNCLDKKTKRGLRIHNSARSYLRHQNNRPLINNRAAMTSEEFGYYIKKGQRMLQIKRVAHEDSLRKHNIYFTLNNLKSNVLFSELSPLANFEFRYAGNATKKQFFAMFRKNPIHDFRIIYTPGDEEGILELKTLKGFIQVVFSLIEEHYSERARQRCVRSFERRHRQYLRELEYKRKAFAKHLQINRVRALLGINGGRYWISQGATAPIITLGNCNIDQILKNYPLQPLVLKFADTVISNQFKYAAVPFNKLNTSIIFRNPNEIVFNEKATDKIVFITAENTYFSYKFTKSELTINAEGTLQLTVNPQPHSSEADMRKFVME